MAWLVLVTSLLGILVSSTLTGKLFLVDRNFLKHQLRWSIQRSYCIHGASVTFAYPQKFAPLLISNTKWLEIQGIPHHCNGISTTTDCAWRIYQGVPFEIKPLDNGDQPIFSRTAVILPLLGLAEPLASTISRPRPVVETLIGPGQTRNSTINDNLCSFLVSCTEPMVQNFCRDRQIARQSRKKGRLGFYFYYCTLRA